MDAPEETERKLKEIIARVFKVRPDELKPECRFKEDLGADSLDLILVLYEVEDHLGVNLSDEEAKQITTVADALRLASQITPK
jgi:acyl carrier protein